MTLRGSQSAISNFSPLTLIGPACPTRPTGVIPVYDKRACGLCHSGGRPPAFSLARLEGLLILHKQLKILLLKQFVINLLYIMIHEEGPLYSSQKA